jgi:hypothetical protein
MYAYADSLPNNYIVAPGYVAAQAARQALS